MVTEPALTAWVAPGPDPAGPSRMGLSVPRGVGTAVRRNRVRRRLRAAWQAVEAQPGTDVLVRAGSRALSVPFQELVESLQRATGERGR
jgi:ribonuclease P protein component